MINNEQRHDFIVVGAGSAGCAVAHQLSRSGRYSVLLLEQGQPDHSPLINMPKGFGALLAGEQYVARYPVNNLSRKKNDEVWLRGKTLGGSSAVNGMLWMRPQAAGFTTMQKAGHPYWDWSVLQKYFDVLDGGEQGQGIFRVGPHKKNHRITEAFVNAAHASSLPIITRKTEIGMPGVAPLQFNISPNRQRISAAHAFLKPAENRSSLSIVTGAKIDRIIFDGLRAVGVAGNKGGADFMLYATKEVILCTGTLESPLILQRSGIGPADWLNEQGVTPLIDSPRVGENLREHLLLGVNFQVTNWEHSENRQYQGPRLLGNLLRYALFRSGPMSQSLCHAAAFIALDEGNKEQASAMMMLNPFSRQKDQFSSEPGVSIVGYAIHPQSKGQVRISSRSPDAAPLICARYLETPHDRDVSVAVVRAIRQLAKQDPLAQYIVKEADDSAWAQTDEEIIELYKRKALPGFHAVGSCAMGSNIESSVVDARTRVHGLQGLRIIDGSIMPEMIAPITNAAIMGLAMHAATLIEEDSAQELHG